MSDALSAAITAAELQLQNTLDQMEGVQQQFILRIGEFLQPWYWETAQEIARENAETTKALGREKLAAFKAAIQALQDRAPGIAAEAFDTDELWWHRKPRENLYYYMHGGRLPNAFDEHLRRAAGQIAPILQNYGYLSSGLADHRNITWTESRERSYSRPGAGRYRYPGMLATPPGSAELLQSYADLQHKAQQQTLAVQAAKRAKDEAEAQSLWDEA